MRIDSLADLPESIRAKIAGKIIEAKQPKYRNTVAVVNGIKFDSQKEANRYSQLMVSLKAGIISDLRLQEDFTLQEAYTSPDGRRIRAIRYRADFTYIRNGQKIIEDTKGFETEVFKMKRKMMEAKGYHIEVI